MPYLDPTLAYLPSLPLNCPTYRATYLMPYLLGLPKQLDDVIQLPDDDIKKRNEYTKKERVHIEWRFVAHLIISSTILMR